MTIHGWNAISDKMMGLYAQSCIECASDDERFENFKQDSGYTTILEGAPKLFFDYYLQAVKSHENYKTFLDNIDKFRINDTLGNPDIYVDPEVGEFSPTTLKFAFNAIDIISFIDKFGDRSKLKNIVEIGGGYGGLCLILSGFFEFDQYTLVDLPETCKLIDKYISNFPHLNGKVKTLPCDELHKFEDEEIDLTIAVNSLSECDLDTQLIYFDKFVSKSNFGYIVRNPDNYERMEEHKKTISTLPDNFLVDDSNKVEEWYSSNIIVYIKKEKN
jgi:putative sugar O-methyltransferase